MPSTEHLDQKAPSRAMDRTRIPNIDLTSLFTDDTVARLEFERKIRDACLENGFSMCTTVVYRLSTNILY